MSQSFSLRDEFWMREALNEAEKAKRIGEIPIGAVVVSGEQIVGRGHNQKESLLDPSAHAEMLAIREASQRLGRWRLYDCSIYSTLEPCPMCAGAMINARIGRLIFATVDPKAGACGSLFQLHSDRRLNHRFDVQSGLMAGESQKLLREFFQKLRKRRRDGRVVEGA